MATALDLLQPLRTALVPVPATQIDVCGVCHSATKAGYPTCYQCGREASSLGGTEVVPITMSIDGGLVHRHLRQYKDARVIEDRDHFTVRLAALLAVFLANHGSCIGEWDYATCVPSETRTAMNAVVSRTKLLHNATRSMLTASPGSWSRQFSEDRYSLTGAVSGDRILLLDDTYVSGASTHSAVAVLRSAGAQVVGPVVLGRHVDPTWDPSAKLLSWLTKRRWDPSRCCRCDGEQRDPAALPL